MNNRFENDTPRIYVASLADYNAGRLHGKWIDCDQDVEDIRQEIKNMLAQSKEPIAEEWAIHDYENFRSLRLGEYEDLEKVVEAAKLIVEYREYFSLIVEHCGGLRCLAEAKRYMEEEAGGEWDSLAHWAEIFLEDTGQLRGVPENLRSYIDFERYGKDAELSGDIFTIDFDGKLHVFWNI